jgi:hypothetical protein
MLVWLLMEKVQVRVVSTLTFTLEYYCHAYLLVILLLCSSLTEL